MTDALNHIEAILIESVEPPLNLQSGRFGQAEQYMQYEDGRLPPTNEKRLEEIVDRLTVLESELD